MPEVEYKSPRSGRVYGFRWENEAEQLTQEDYDVFARKVEQIEMGTEQSAFRSFTSAVGQGLTTMPGTVLQGVGAMLGSSGIEAAGKEYAEDARKTIPIDPMRRDDFSTKAGQAVGQAIGQLGLGLVTGGGSIGTSAVLGTAAAMGAASGSERAEQSGLTGARRMGRVYGSALTELASERLFGLGSKTFFKPAAIPTTIGQKGLRFAGTSLGEGGEEIAAGVGNNIVDNVTAAGLDIPTPDIVGMNAFKSYAEQGLLGMVGGTVFAGAQLALGSQAAATPVTRAYATVDGMRMDVTDLSPTQRKDLGIDEATVEYESILPTEDADIASGIQNKNVRDMFTEMKTNSDAAALDQALNVGQASSVLTTAMGAGTPAAGTPAAAVTPAPTQAPIVSTPGEEAMTSTGAPTPVGVPAAAAADITEFPAEGPTNLVDLSNLRFTGTPTQTPTFNATLQGDFTENRVEERVQTNEGGTPTEAGRSDSTVERGQVEPPVAENEAVAPAPPLVEPGGEGLLNVIAPREKGAVATAADELVKGIGGKLKPRARPATTPAAAPTAPAAPTQTEFPVPQAPASPQAIVNSIQDLTNTVTGGTAGTGSIGGAETISLQSEGEPTVSLPAAESPMPRGSGGLGAEGTGAPAAPAAAAPAAPAAAAPAGAPVTPEAAAPAAAAAAAPAAAPTGAPAAAPEAAATEEAPTEEPNTAEPEDYKTEDSKDIFVEPQKKGFFSQFFGEDNPYSPKEKQSDEMLRNEFVRPYIIDGRSKTTQQKTDEMYELMDTLRSRKRLEAQRQQNIAIDPKYGNYDAVPAVQLAEIYLYASRLNDGGRMLRDLKSVGSLFYYSYEGTGRSAARGLNAISHFVRKINIAKAYDIHRKGQSKNAAKNIGVDENDLLDIQGFVDGATIPTEDLNQGLGNAVVNTGVPGQAAVLVDDVVANQLRTQPAPPVTTASEPLVTEAEVAPQVAAEAASAAQAKAVERAQTESRGLDPDTTTEIGDNIFSINPEPKSPNAPKVTPAQARILVTQTLGFTPKNVAFEDTDVPNEDGDQYAGKVNKRTKQVTINLRNINDSTHLKDVLFEEMDHLVYADPMVQAEIALLAENLPEDIRQEVRQYRPEFQREEATIRFMRRLEQEPNTSSLWKKFVDAVRAAIRRLFNGQLTTRDLKMAADRVAARSFQAMAAQTFLTGQGGTSYSVAPKSPEAIRHGELEAKFNAGTITPEEEAEAKQLVQQRAQANGYNRKGVRFGFYVNGVPLPPSQDAELNFGPGYYVAEDATLDVGASGVSVSKTPNPAALKKLGLDPGSVEYREDSVFVKAAAPYRSEYGSNATPETKAFIEATFAYESAVQEAKRRLELPTEYVSYGKIVADLIAQGRIPFDSLAGMTGRKGMTSELVVQNASQIKSSQTFNGIPLDERFDARKDDIRYSVTPESQRIDQEYLAAVEAGDMKTAQRIINEAAKMAAKPFSIKTERKDFSTETAVSIGGKTVSVFRDPENGYWYFSDKGGLGDFIATSKEKAIEAAVERIEDEQGGAEPSTTVQFSDWKKRTTITLPGFYLRFGDLPKEGKSVKGNQPGEFEQGVSVLKAWRSPDGVFVISSFTAETGPSDMVSGLQTRPVYIAYGEDTGKIGSDGEPLLKNVVLTEQVINNRIVVDDPSYIDQPITNNVRSYDKWETIEPAPDPLFAAETVVKDKAGKIILPSERFQKTSDDIRYSLAPKSPEAQIEQEYKVAVEKGNAAVIASGHELTREVYDELKSKFKPKPRDVFYVADTEVIRNPSDSDRRRMSAEVRSEFGRDSSGDPATRFTKDTFNNTWIWKSHQGMHFQIEPGITSREGVEVNQNNRVPEHVELVQDALRANKPVPLKVQEQYPRYAEFFAKLPPYQTNRTTSDDIRYSVPNPNDPAPETPDLGPNIFTEEASALAATTAKLRAKIKVQPPPKVAKVKADPNIEFTKGFIASWDRNSGKEKADAKPKEKIPAKEVISEFTSLPKKGKGYALTDTGRDAFLTALNQKLVNLGVPSDLAFEATRRAWATYSTKKQKNIDAKALREAQKSIAEQERLAKKEEARVTKPDRTAQAFIDRTDESQTEIVIEPGVKTGDPVAQALREASMAPRIGPGFDSSPEAKRAYVNSLSAKLVSLGVTQATAETASSRAWLKYQASRSSKEVELRDREALAAAKKETRQREIQAKKDEKAIQAAIDKPNNSAQSFMDSVDESQTEFMPAERTVDPVMQALREASSVPKIGAPFDLSSEAKKAFLTGLKSKLMSLGVDETMARNASDRAWTKYQTKRTAKQKTIRENEAAAKAKKAQDALDKPTNTAKDYLKPATAPKGPAVQDPVKKALRDAEKIPRIGAAFNSSPEARNAFMTGLSSKLISLGVEQQTAWAAANKAWSTYQTNLADKVTALRKDIEKNKMSSILTRELKKIPVYQQNDIQYVREYMKNILVFGGLAEDVADAAATLYLNEYVDLMKQTKVKTAEKFIESESGTKIKKKIASKPTEYDKLMEAVRLGVTDRSFTAALAFTTPSKFQAFTQADHDRMVALEEEIQDPDTPNLIKVQKVNELMKLADSRMNDINALNVFTGYLVNNTLSGIGTAAIQIFTPFYSMGTRLATDGVRGLMTKDPQRFIASLYAVMDAADTVTAEFKYSFGNDVFRRGQQAELRTLTDLRKVLDNNLKIYQTTTNGLEKVVAASKIALAAPDYVRRLYSAMDTASQSLFINQIKVVGIYDAMKKNGMSLKKFKDMLDAKRTFRDAYTLTLHGQGGYTKNQIRLIAEDAAMNDFGEKVAAAIGQGGAETISDVYKMADLEGPSEIGVAESADGHVIPFLLDVLDSIKAAGDKAGGEGAGQLAFRLVLGYPTTALKVLNRSLYFFPPTAVVRMILNKRYENQADFDPEAPRKYEMLRTESQKHQRMAELVTGSLASIILMALIMDERDKEEKDRRFAVHNLGPSDRAAKQAWRAAGNVQQSIQWRASETSPWISVSWAKAGLESLAPVLALVGTVYDSRDEIVDEGKMADHALNVAGGVMGVFNRPLSGLNDIGEILSGEKNSISQKSLASYTAFRASGLVPFSSLLKTYNRTQGPRDMSTATSTMMSQIPIAGPSLTEPGINLFGDPLEATPNELTYKLPILPVQVGLRQKDVPFYEKMLSKGQYPPLKLRTTFEKTYGPVTDSVWRQYVEKRGQMVKKLIIDRWTDLDTLSPEIYDKVLGKFAEAADETVIQELKIQRVPKPVIK